MMSPTVNASSLQATDNPLYQLAQARKKFDSNMASSRSERLHSSSGSSSGDELVSAAPLTHRQPSAYAADYTSVSALHAKRRAGSGIARDWFDARRNDKEEEEEEDEEQPVLGVAKLVNLPDAPFRDWRRISGEGRTAGDQAGRVFSLGSPDAQDRATFPAAASVSLPTSTSTLDYLLHQHSSDRCDLHKNDKSVSHGSSISSAASTAKSSAGSLLPTAVDSSSDYLSKYYASLGLNSRENVAGFNGVTPETMMTKTGSGTASADLDNRKAEDMTGNPSSERGRQQSRAISQQFFQVEPCLFTHRMFIRAAKIFHVLKSEDTDTVEAKASKRRRGEPEVKQKIPDMEFRNAQEQIKTFELTFATLKCE